MIRLALPLLVLACSAEAQSCRIQTAGSSCIAVPQSDPPPPLLSPGDILPRGEYFMIMNAPHYGLPRAEDGWVYYRVGDDIMRVDRQSLEVLEIVTDMAARNFQ